MNIKEDYVSFETAKLLKEKGFDWHTYAYYEDENNPNISLRASKAINWNKTEFISKPTLQMTMKWMREEHNIAINIGWGEVFEDKFQWWCIILNYKDGSILRESEYYATREEACEEAIKYCLEHLI